MTVRTGWYLAGNEGVDPYIVPFMAYDNPDVIPTAVSILALIESL